MRVSTRCKTLAANLALAAALIVVFVVGILMFIHCHRYEDAAIVAEMSSRPTVECVERALRTWSSEECSDCIVRTWRQAVGLGFPEDFSERPVAFTIYQTDNGVEIDVTSALALNSAQKQTYDEAMSGAVRYVATRCFEPPVAYRCTGAFESNLCGSQE